MWKVENKTPFAAQGGFFRDGDGAEVWTVAVKATYELLPDGRTRIADHQLPINTGPVLHEDGVSPIYETDLGPRKAATDVWLVGHAHSQTMQPISRTLVGFEVGPIKRCVQVFGDRHWQLGAFISKPLPFTRMPLVWARAYGGGGPDCRTGNPVGCGVRKDADGVIRLPNLENPRRLQGSTLLQAPAQGLGPIPSHWPLRRKYAGTYDETWRKTRAPLRAQDLNPKHWQVAVAEQQAPERLKGGEAVLLQGVTPPGFAKHGVYHTLLPKLSLSFSTRFYDNSPPRTSRSVIHNVILQPDGHQGSGPLLSVVHHIALPCHPKVHVLDRTIVTAKQRPLDKPVSAQAQSTADIDWEEL